jgi:hypothetical protein
MTKWQGHPEADLPEVPDKIAEEHRREEAATVCSRLPPWTAIKRSEIIKKEVCDAGI